MVQMLSSKVFSVEKLFSSDNIECSFIMFDFFFDILKILGEYGGERSEGKLILLLKVWYIFDLWFEKFFISGSIKYGKTLSDTGCS